MMLRELGTVIGLFDVDQIECITIMDTPLSWELYLFLKSGNKICIFKDTSYEVVKKFYDKVVSDIQSTEVK